MIADQLLLSLSPSNSGVVLTGVDTPVTHPYVFPDSSPIGVVEEGGTVAEAGDFLTTGSAPLPEGVGLLRLDYSVAGGTPPGSYAISISPNPSDSYLVDDAYAEHPFHGLRRPDHAACAEPSSLLLLLPIGIAAIAWRGLRQKPR